VALRLDPDSGLAYHARGAALSVLGQYERALKDLDEAIRLGQGDALVFVARGFAFAGLGRHERAIADYDEAIRLDPSMPDAYTDRGTARCRLGDVAGALADWDRFAELGGEAVRVAVQEFLAEQGFYSGPVTGNYDLATLAARRAYAESGCK
jgi:tetratricopeptide (TPR) repeat protein